jgi:predicted transposase/invertase (TIGR01784 family)
LENASDSKLFELCCGTKPFKDPKDDFTFKHLMGSEKNKPLSISFINSVFEDEHVRENHRVTDLNFVNTVLNPTRIYGRQGCVDALSVGKDQRMITVEMQKEDEDNLLDCFYRYACHLSANQLDRGQEYESIQEVTIIALADYDIFPDRPGYIFNHVILDTESHTLDFKSVRCVVINLEKVKLSIDEVKTPLEKWVYFYTKATGCDSEDKKKISKDDRIFKQAFDEIVSYHWSKEDQIAYIRLTRKAMRIAAKVARRVAERIEAAKQKAKEEGIKKGIEKCARNMITLGMDLHEISNLTNLSVDFIFSLKSSMSRERQLEPSSMSRKRKQLEPTNATWMFSKMLATTLIIFM